MPLGVVRSGVVGLWRGEGRASLRDDPSVTDDEECLPGALSPGRAALVGGPAIGQWERGGDGNVQLAGVDHLGQPREPFRLRRHDQELGRDAVRSGQLLRGRLLEDQEPPAASEPRIQRFRRGGADDIDGIDGIDGDVEGPVSESMASWSTSITCSAPRVRAHATSLAWAMPVTRAPSAVAGRSPGGPASGPLIAPVASRGCRYDG